MAYCQVNWSTETVIWMGNSINLCMRGCGEWRLSFDKCQQRAKAVVWGDIPWRNDDGTSRITDHWSPLTSRMTRSVYADTPAISHRLHCTTISWKRFPRPLSVLFSRNCYDKWGIAAVITVLADHWFIAAYRCTATATTTFANNHHNTSHHVQWCLPPIFSSFLQRVVLMTASQV